jgi:hypothetical protein
MESNSLEGHILVSEATKTLLQSSFSEYYEFEFHKEVHISAIKKDIQSYFVYSTQEYED